MKKSTLSLLVQNTGKNVLTKTAEQIDNHRKNYQKILVFKSKMMDFEEEDFKTFEKQYKEIEDYFFSNFTVFDYDKMPKYTTVELLKHAEKLEQIEEYCSDVRCYISIHIEEVDINNFRT